MKCKVKIGTLVAFVLVLFGHAQNRPSDSITGKGEDCAYTFHFVFGAKG